MPVRTRLRAHSRPMTETGLDDVCAVLGYSATRRLAAWFPGRVLWVPQTATADHFLAVLLGLRPFRALVAAYGGDRIVVPTEAGDDAARRDRRIAEMMAAGRAVPVIAEAVGLSVRRVQQVRDELILSGLLTYLQAPRRGQPPPLPPEILGTGEVSQETPLPVEAGVAG